jgi:hypothetical protein
MCFREFAPPTAKLRFVALWQIVEAITFSEPCDQQHEFRGALGPSQLLVAWSARRPAKRAADRPREALRVVVPSGGGFPQLSPCVRFKWRKWDIVGI